MLKLPFEPTPIVLVKFDKAMVNNFWPIFQIIQSPIATIFSKLKRSTIFYPSCLVYHTIAMGQLVKHLTFILLTAG